MRAQQRQRQGSDKTSRKGTGWPVQRHLRYSLADCSHDCMASSASAEHSLALPRCTSVHFNRPRQHVAVQELANLALPQADLCSELTRQLPGADFQQAVRIKRCAQPVAVVDCTNAGGAVSASDRAVAGLMLTTNFVLKAGSLGVSMADPFTGQQLQPKITTHVAERCGAAALAGQQACALGACCGRHMGVHLTCCTGETSIQLLHAALVAPCQRGLLSVLAASSQACNAADKSALLALLPS